MLKVIAAVQVQKLTCSLEPFVLTTPLSLISAIVTGIIYTASSAISGYIAQDWKTLTAGRMRCGITDLIFNVGNKLNSDCLHQS